MQSCLGNGADYSGNRTNCMESPSADRELPMPQLAGLPALLEVARPYGKVETFWQTTVRLQGYAQGCLKGPNKYRD
jgi:hypothetical protein